ncbi:uncharacterized protein LOC134837699 [Culicoides brevitarsis]|uniref:uncharacterized protein LOC134837699 n=1 Tax=Culicoides brevitarsis TaxID=469753 RepID=UPI00307B1C85
MRNSTTQYLTTDAMYNIFPMLLLMLALTTVCSNAVESFQKLIAEIYSLTNKILIENPLIAQLEQILQILTQNPIEFGVAGALFVINKGLIISIMELLVGYYTMLLSFTPRLSNCTYILAFELESLSLFVMIQLNQYFAYWYHIIISIIIASVRAVQFVFFIDMLQARLGMLNECLEECVESQLGFLEIPSDFFLHDVLRRKLRQQRLFRQFCVIKDVFKRLGDVHRLCNEVFGNSMLAIVLQIFIFLCTNTYWSILQHTEKISTIFPMDPIVHIISLSIQLFFMVDRCTKCQAHLVTMKKLIDKLDLKEDQDFIKDFALQITHSNFTVSANGYFDFNYQLISSVYSSVMTYILVMAQFEAEES